MLGVALMVAGGLSGVALAWVAWRASVRRALSPRRVRVRLHSEAARAATPPHGTPYARHVPPRRRRSRGKRRCRR